MKNFATQTGQPEPEPLPAHGETNRVVGVILLVLTALIFRSEILQPLAAAAQHDTKAVSISNAVIAIPFFFILACLFTVLGRNAYRVMGPPRQPSVLGWSITAVALGLGFYLEYWMRCQLQDYGYGF